MDHLEVHEDWPSWVTTQLEVLNRFTEQIRAHLKVLEGIGIQVDNLGSQTAVLGATADKQSVATVQLNEAVAKSSEVVGKLSARLDNPAAISCYQLRN